MVSLVSPELSQRETLLSDLFHLATLLERVDAKGEPYIFVHSTMKGAVQRMFNTLARPDWEDQGLTLRSLNMSLRGLIYDIEGADPSNRRIYAEILQYSKSLEMELLFL